MSAYNHNHIIMVMFYFVNKFLTMSNLSWNAFVNTDVNNRNLGWNDLKEVRVNKTDLLQPAWAIGLYCESSFSTALFCFCVASRSLCNWALGPPLEPVYILLHMKLPPTLSNARQCLTGSKPPKTYINIIYVQTQFSLSHTNAHTHQGYGYNWGQKGHVLGVFSGDLEVSITWREVYI